VLHVPSGLGFPKVAKISALRQYANLKSKDIRTVRGWCQTGKIPARFDGTRWHLHPLLIAKEESLRYFRRYFGDGDGKHPLTERDKRALEYLLVKMNLRDPEERRKYIFYRLCAPEEREKFKASYAEVSGQPCGDILTSSDWLKLKNGSVPAVEELREHLHTSKSTLYQRIPRIMEVLKKRYRTDDSPDGVHSQIAGLPWDVRVVGAVDFDYDAIGLD
jgi:hypothetical protein